MPSSAHSSYLAPAVEKVLGLFAGEDEVARGINGQLSSYHVFSYREDFDYLWGIGDSENESVVADAIASEQRSSLVLVNDGVPDAFEQFAGPSLNIRDRITVYDWIVNFFLSVIDGEDAPSVRLFVLDVTSQAAGDSFASQRLQSLLPLMPWVRVYRLFDDLTGLQSRLGHFRVGLGHLVAEAVRSDVSPLASVDEDTSENAKDLIREAWINELTRPEGRHDVSNLVAPLVLAEGLDQARDLVQHDSRRAALAKLLRTLGVLGRQDMHERVSSPLVTPMVADNILGQFDDVQFLLVDDQASLGYHDVLASLLFGEDRTRTGRLESISSDRDETGENGRFSLRSVTDPTPLADSLYETTGLSGEGQIVDWSHPRVLDALSASDNEEVEEAHNFDVLLLDLRLFGTSGSSPGNEADFLKRLIDFHDQSGVDRLNDPYLKRAVEAAEAKVEQDSSASQKDVSELMHLALLPLLLSYVDPSLPILLFSSTRQQAVVDAISHRPGIITSFQKPVVSGYTEERSPHDYVVSLSDALTDALQLHEARCIWKRIVKTDWKEYPPFRAAGSEKVAVVTENARKPDRNVFRENWSVAEGPVTVDVSVRIALSETDGAETDSEETDSERTKTWIPVRESDIDWDNGTWVFDVFNYPHDDLPAFDEKTSTPSEMLAK